MTASKVPAEPASEDERQLEEEITQARERLGETVEQLAAKLDVKSQAQAKAKRIQGQLRSRAVRVRNQAAAGAAQARQWAVTATGSAPAPVRHAASKGASAAKRRPVQLAAGTAALLIATLVAVLVRRKR